MKDYKFEDLLLELCKIRDFENGILDLFSKGLIKGTTHTCLGQEVNAVGIINSLENSDIVISNHRCHGHFLSHTKNFEGLLLELLGKKNGVCGGLGGSQHLCVPGKFYSNGILGGPISSGVGMAYAQKLKKLEKLICLFIGDGTFGEGTLYESINIASKNKLSTLFVVEDNGIAQSSKTSETTAGALKNKMESFDIYTEEINYPDLKELLTVSNNIIKKVRNNIPSCLIIKSVRLGPHSKGDDDRSESEISKLKNKDPFENTLKQIKIKDNISRIKAESNKYISDIFEKCISNNEYTSIDKSYFYQKQEIDIPNKLPTTKLKPTSSKKFGQIINNTLNNLLANDEKIILIGEDISDPYGGAFKITKGLSSKFQNRLYSSPISESAIVGIAGGLALEGFKPIVEIMFGDFLSLTFDQLLNNLCKYYFMYNKLVKNPLIIRTPMGGRRGYGPTHSQSIEKHFFGINGLSVYALNPFQNIYNLYQFAFKDNFPSLFIENKTDYNFNLNDFDGINFNNFELKYSHNSDFTTSFSLSSFKNDDGLVFCYGGMLSHTLNAVKKAYLDEEISCKIVCLGKISPLNPQEILSHVNDNDFIITLEDSSNEFGYGSEIASIILQNKKIKNTKFKKIGSTSSFIPSSFKLESELVLSENDIYKSILEIYKDD